MPEAPPNWQISRWTSITAQRDLAIGTVDVIDQIIGTVYEGVRGAAGIVIDFANAMENELRSSRRRFLAIHEEVAVGAQQAMLTAYRAAYAASPRPHNGYRADAGRYAAGVLEEALNTPGLVKGTIDGIAYVDPAFLDTRARQWHRLNFGAGAAANYTPRDFPVRWGALVVASLSLEGEGPSPPFMIPAGFWKGEAPVGEFYPANQMSATNVLRRVRGGQQWFHQKKVFTKGIRAWNFMDAGLEYIAKTLPVKYDEAMRSMYQLASERGIGAVSRIERQVQFPKFSAPRVGL